MKIVTICQRGNSRSVALAYLIKHELKHEAIAIGVRQHSAETKKMLFDWADVLILTDKRFLPEIPTEYHTKLKIYDVGRDKFFRGFDEGLLQTFRDYLKNDPLVLVEF